MFTAPFTVWLPSCSVDMLTVQEDGRRNTPDELRTEQGSRTGSVLFSQDDNLLQRQPNAQRGGIPFPALSLIMLNQILAVLRLPGLHIRLNLGAFKLG